MTTIDLRVYPNPKEGILWEVYVPQEDYEQQVEIKDKKGKQTMKWYVFYNDDGDIINWNVFEHMRFNEDVQKALKKCKTKEELSDALYHEAFYYFASKCEYEVVISQWVGKKTERKIDIFMQLRMNWNVFVDYVWRHKNG